MDMKDYFEGKKGVGVLSTADSEGKLDAAIYARPHVLEDGAIAFIMNDRLTHHNLTSNPHVAYLFIEEGEGYKGKRLFLTKIKEEKESELLHSLRRKSYPKEQEIEKGAKFLVIFSVDKELPLIGAGE